MNIGPMQLVFTAFEGDVLESGVIDELFAATGDAVLLLDLLAVEKDDEGRLWLSDLSDETAVPPVQYGQILGQMIDIGADEPISSQVHGNDREVTRFIVGISPGEVNDLVFSLTAGHSALIALFEHAWAANLRQSVYERGGVLLAQALIQPEALAGMEEALSSAIVRASATWSESSDEDVAPSTADNN